MGMTESVHGYFVMSMGAIEGKRAFFGEPPMDLALREYGALRGKTAAVEVECGKNTAPVQYVHKSDVLFYTIVIGESECLHAVFWKHKDHAGSSFTSAVSARE